MAGSSQGRPVFQGSGHSGFTHQSGGGSLFYKKKLLYGIKLAMLATCEHASGQGGMYVYDVYLQGMWVGAAICPLVVEEKQKQNKNGYNAVRDIFEKRWKIWGRLY